jgi:hypothetical protein
MCDVEAFYDRLEEQHKKDYYAKSVCDKCKRVHKPILGDCEKPATKIRLFGKGAYRHITDLIHLRDEKLDLWKVVYLINEEGFERSDFCARTDDAKDWQPFPSEINSENIDCKLYKFKFKWELYDKESA